MLILELKEKLGFKNKTELDKYIADLFGFKTIGAYQNSSAKKRYETALCKFYSFLMEGEKNNKITPTEPD